MQTLQLIPILQPASEAGAATRQAVAAGVTAARLWLDAEGRLAVTDPPDRPAGAAPTLLAGLVCRPTPSGPVWFLLPRSALLLLNGVRPLPLAVVEPGALLLAGRRGWFVTSEWTPAAADCPADLGERQCPVCGGELRLAPVVRCVCGRYTHLEDAERPNDSALLNCYLAGPCGACQRPPSLAPMLVPEPPDALVPAAEVGVAR